MNNQPEIRPEWVPEAYREESVIEPIAKTAARLTTPTNGFTKAAKKKSLRKG